MDVSALTQTHSNALDNRLNGNIAEDIAILNPSSQNHTDSPFMTEGLKDFNQYVITPFTIFSDALYLRQYSYEWD